MSQRGIKNQAGRPAHEELVELKLMVRADLYGAFQRCTWLIVNETGRNRLDLMNEVVRDFLIKHGG